MSICVSLADLPLLRRAVRQFTGAEGSQAFLDVPGALAFVACDGDEIVGWCWGYHLVRPNGSSAVIYLHDLEVAETHRRRGIGRELLRAFMAEGVKGGAIRMSLSTGLRYFAARSLYESMGGSERPGVNYLFLLDR